MSDNSYRRIARSITVFGGAQAFSVLAALVRNKVISVLIGPTGVGLNALYSATSQFVSTLSGLGLSSSAVRSLSEDQASGEAGRVADRVARLRKLGLWLGAMGAVLTLLLSPLLSRYYFGDMGRTLAFASLSLVVLTSVMGGIEMAVLKALQRTRDLALCTFLGAVSTVVCTVPFYWLWRLEGVIWALVVCTVVTALVAMAFGHRALPLRLSAAAGGEPLLTALRPMLTLGLAFLASGLLATGVELAVQSYLQAVASLAILGLYRAGYQIGVTYPGMIFTAIDNDFYPRLSAVNADVAERNRLVRRQALVQVAFAVGVVALAEVLVPWLLPLLFSDEFSGAIPMARWAMLAVILRALYLPLGFLPLALGRAADFLLVETVSWLLLGLGIVVGYRLGGLAGIGLSLLVSQTVDLGVLFVFCRWRYGFRLCDPLPQS